MPKFSTPPHKSRRNGTKPDRPYTTKKSGRPKDTGWSPLGSGRIDIADDEQGTAPPPRRQKHREPPRERNLKPKLAVSEPPRASKKFGQLLYGLHAVREAWLNPARLCRQLWLSGSMNEEFVAVMQQAQERGLQRPAPMRADKATLDQMLPGAVHQGIVLDTTPLPETSLEQLLKREPKLVVVLDQVTDPHNVGAIMRSAAAFGAAGIILTERHAPSMTGTLAKTASGALEHVALVHVVNLARALDQLRDAGFWCVGLAEEGARDLRQLDLSGATALVLGAEGEGLRRLTRERCDELARLPTQGAIGSLNVSNAAAVALYEAQRQK